MPHGTSGGEWSDDAIRRLRQFWAVGHSTSEIGRRLGVSKNAVVGKAHRLDLPGRPSPIRRGIQPASRPRPARPKPPKLADIMPMPASDPAPEQPLPDRKPPRPTLTAARQSQPAPQIDQPRAASCCWPIGHPGTPSFRFCTAAALIGKPYCTEHAQIAYVKVRRRNEGGMASAN